MVKARWFLPALALLTLSVNPVDARPLDAVKSRGVLSLCAHPDALPFASRSGSRPGLQIELARALARRLGVQLEVEWVLVAVQYRRVDCDVILDTIVDPQALEERRIRASIPYQQSGVVLAVREGEASRTPMAGLGDFVAGRKIGVQVGSVVQVELGRQGARTSPFAFESEMMEALVGGEIDAAAVTPTTIGWWNLNHPDKRMTSLPVFADEPDLQWNLAVGMRRSDEAFRDAVDAAIRAMLDDGTIAQIYASYGIEHRAPG